MKIILTEKQMSLLKEDNLEYSVDKKEIVISKAHENLGIVNKFYENYKSIVFGLTIGNVVDDFDKYVTLLEKMKSTISQIDNKVNEYYNIYDIYGVEELNSIQSEMDNISYQIGAFHDVLDQILFFAKNYIK